MIAQNDGRYPEGIQVNRFCILISVRPDLRPRITVAGTKTTSQTMVHLAAPNRGVLARPLQIIRFS
jgi:hypothetical protein